MSQPDPDVELEGVVASAAPAPGTVTHLRRLLAQELLDRLNDPDERRKLPGQGLLTLLRECMRIEEKETPAQAEQADVLEQITAAGLPLGRKKLLLREERARLEKRIAQVDKVFAGLPDRPDWRGRPDPRKRGKPDAGEEP